MEFFAFQVAGGGFGAPGSEGGGGVFAAVVLEGLGVVLILVHQPEGGEEVGEGDTGFRIGVEGELCVVGDGHFRAQSRPEGDAAADRVQQVGDAVPEEEFGLDQEGIGIQEVMGGLEFLGLQGHEAGGDQCQKTEQKCDLALAHGGGILVEGESGASRLPLFRREKRHGEAEGRSPLASRGRRPARRRGTGKRVPACRKKQNKPNLAYDGHF